MMGKQTKTFWNPNYNMCYFEMITDNPSTIFVKTPQKQRCVVVVVRNTTSFRFWACWHAFTNGNVQMDFRNLPSILLALTVQKRCQSSKSTDGGQRYGKSTQMTPEVGFLLVYYPIIQGWFSLQVIFFWTDTTI